MVNFTTYKKLMAIKNGSPFTRDLTIKQYIRGVRHRIGVYYNICTENLTLEEILNYIEKSSNNE